MLITKTNTNWCARVLLVLVAMTFTTSAKAATIYNFTFNDGADVVASGSFTTDGVGVDPGYELVVSLWFDYAQGNDLGVIGPFRAQRFYDGQAYNPTTGAFINHRGPDPEHDLGGMGLVGSPLDVSLFSSAFALNGRLGGYVRDNGQAVDTLRFGTLAVAPVVTAGPEPTSLVLLGTGLAGLVVRARRKKA